MTENFPLGYQQNQMAMLSLRDKRVDPTPQLPRFNLFKGEGLDKMQEVIGIVAFLKFIFHMSNIRSGPPNSHP